MNLDKKRDSRGLISHSVPSLASRIHGLEVKCENLEAENKQQAETILRLDRRITALQYHKDAMHLALDESSRRQGDLQRRLEAIEERLAKPKAEVII